MFCSYHIYCVGLEEIPEGSWHCEECTFCASCRIRDKSKSQNEVQWVTEYKTNASGVKIYSHTMCQPCHK